MQTCTHVGKNYGISISAISSIFGYYQTLFHFAFLYIQSNYQFGSAAIINSVLLQLSIRFCCNYQFGSAAIINSVLLQLSIRFCCSYQFGSAAFINSVQRRCSRKNRLHPKRTKRASFKRLFNHVGRAVARTLIGGGGAYIFMYSCSARRVSFQIKFKFLNLKRNLSGKT